MNQYFKIIFFIVTVLMSAYSFSKNTGPDFKLFEKKFHNWTRAFNIKTLPPLVISFRKRLSPIIRVIPKKIMHPFVVDLKKSLLNQIININMILNCMMFIDP